MQKIYKSIQTVFVGDGNYDNLKKSIENGKQPFKYVDYLFVAFADLEPNSNSKIYFKIDNKPDKPPINYELRAREIVAEAKKQNPGLVIFAQVNWAKYLKPLDDKAKIEAFAKSIPPFLKEYGFGGIDFDWEFGGEPPLATELASHLFTCVKTEIGSGAYLSISADTKDALDPEVINKQVDIVILQSYGLNRFYLIDTFINDLKIEKEKIYIGIASENDDARNDFFPPGCGISDYIQKCLDTGVAGLYAWRIDNDDTDHATNLPRYTITKQMWQFTKGTMAAEIDGNVFDDTEMDRDRTNGGAPRKLESPITQLVVRYGDVLNAIQATNGDLKLPQHGGYSGAQKVIDLTNDKIIKITVYTGKWFGWDCVLKFTLTTEKNNSYDCGGSMANTSDQKQFDINAPDGQSIVAFKGSLINVKLEDGSETTIIKELSVSCA